MQTMNKLLPILALGILIGLLSACAAVPTAPQTGVTPQPSGPVESDSTGPIVGTASSGEAQELPQPTATGDHMIAGAPIVTLQHNGQTLILQPGERFILMLGEGYSWEIEITRPEVVSEVMGLAPVKGSQGVFEGRQAGQADLFASGDPLCRNEKPACMRPSIAFSLTITVR